MFNSKYPEIDFSKIKQYLLADKRERVRERDANVDLIKLFSSGPWRPEWVGEWGREGGRDVFCDEIQGVKSSEEMRNDEEDEKKKKMNWVRIKSSSHGNDDWLDSESERK